MSASTSADSRERILILGAAGRDFHDFNLLYREDPVRRGGRVHRGPDPGHRRTHLPGRAGRPAVPARHPDRRRGGAEGLTRGDERVDTVVLAYSDLAHAQVMHLASRVDRRRRRLRRVRARGARRCARGARWSPSRRCARAWARARPRATSPGCCATSGLRVVAVRHPMPYGDLAAQACQRFETLEDLVRHDCTIEEREEYEPHIEAGVVVYAGVDYGRILREAEAEADVVLWDGGNNDLPFYVPDLHLVLADPLRPGDEAGIPPRRGERADGRRRPRRQVRLGAARGRRGCRGVGARRSTRAPRCCAATAR